MTALDLTGVVTFAMAWAGATLLMSYLSWFEPLRLAQRLGPYLPAGHPARKGPADRPPPHAGRWVAIFAVALGPASLHLGDLVARVSGVRESPGARLERIHASGDVGAFRARQLGWAVAASAGGAVACGWLRPSPAVAFVVLLAAPIGAFAVLEHRLSQASTAWQRRVVAELPVICEQLGMLLRSGYSLGGALERVAAHSSGRCSRDLARACGRIRQGLSTQRALDEWATTSGLEPVRRLVGVLRLDREATDLGRLLSEEARLGRAESHRRLIETAERRAQQVWIPVTVAALVPGVIFLAVPFTAALSAFGGG